MSLCSAAEVAEKRRIALEKLAAKKQRMSQLNNPVAAQQSSIPVGSSNVLNNIKSVSNHREQLSSRQSTISATNSVNDMKRGANSVPYMDFVANAKRYKKERFTETSARLVLNDNGKSSKSVATMPVCICKVYMVTVTRFAAQPSNYQPQLVDVFKTISSRMYDNNTRIWTFGLDEYEILLLHVEALKPHVIIDAIPRQVVALCRAPATKLDYACLTSIEPTLAEKLMPFQQEGVCAAIARYGRFMICDEMGLGKTYQGLAVADFYRESWPLLICTAASVRNSWATHIRQLLPHVCLHSIQILTSAQQYVDDAKVLITSYSLLDKYEEKLKANKFGFIIFDESHALKNSKTKCATVAERLARQARHVILLSGTPALSRPLELYTQMHMIDYKFMRFKEYTLRYCDAKQTRYCWDASGQSNLEELNIILNQKFMIRRTKEAVLPQLAEKMRETIKLDPALIWTSDETKTSIDEFNKNYKQSKGREREDMLLKFYTRTGEVKARAVCKYLENIVKEVKKFVVFAHHRVMLDAITECFNKLDVRFIRIDGTTRNDMRAEYIDTFQTKPKCQVALLSLKACNVGITLTAAEMIIFAELDWNPSTLAQAESRAHRIGQENQVVCRYLMASQTADDIIWSLLKSKQDTLHRAGLFCDNLQNAKHTIAASSSPKIDKYFSPLKKNLTQCKTNNNIPTGSTDANAMSIPGIPVATEKANEDLDKELRNAPTKEKDLENVEQFFQDDDDDDFRDLVF